MGIPSQIAVAILREHRFRPITGRLLSIGRQTVYLTAQDAAALVERELGVPPRAPLESLEVDRTTLHGHGLQVITDRAFYSLFCDGTYRCLDVSPYEGADIVWDLCQPIPAELEGQFDFIIDGSCLDNTFDPAQALRNFARLLRPGGRIILLNHAARRHNAYVAFSLGWFHDFFAINGFADCQVYLAQWDGDQQLTARWDFYHYRPMREIDGVLSYFGQDQYYFPWRDSHCVVIAEKGNDSDWKKSPVQFLYRPNVTWDYVDGVPEVREQVSPKDAEDPYFAAALRFYQSNRPVLVHPHEQVELPAEVLHYAPTIVYCGSLPSVPIR